MSSLVIAVIVLVVGALVRLLFRRGRPRIGLVLAAAAAALLIAGAETPFGIGNGKVPDLVGVDECTATKRLDKRGLRWRVGDGPVGRVSSSCTSDEPFFVSTVADRIEAQRPAPGTDLGEDGVVVLHTDCGSEPTCGGARESEGPR